MKLRKVLKKILIFNINFDFEMKCYMIQVSVVITMLCVRFRAWSPQALHPAPLN